MDKNDLVPLIVQEECAEVIQAISKVFRFGKDRKYPDENSTSNKQNLEVEIGQLLFSIDGLIRLWELDPNEIDEAYSFKKATCSQWEKYFVD